ncbi:MAG: sugar transferase [Deltaproteobacteria bacterium]|nr:sugar transferase [Deltaproteobacteria bacterium]
MKGVHAPVLDWHLVAVGPATPLWQRIVAVIGLVLLSPVILLVGLATKSTSPGTILYRGQRVGRGGETFTIFKFRTLEVGAEQKIGARLLEHGDGLYTRIGRYLKRAKLDEIPQLFNVVRGEMNLVGPRPVRPVFLETFCREIPGYMRRFAVNPGMTGLAQLRGGYFTHPRDKLRYDLIYIRNHRWFLDVRLVTLTFIKVLNRWATLGVVLTLLFLSAALLPGLFHYPFQLDLGSFKLSPFEMLVAITAAWLIVQRSPRHELCLYTTPVNRPMGVFVSFAVLAAFFSTEPVPALQGVAYYVATGFCLTFLIVNTRLTQREANLIATVVGLSAVSVSLIGLVQIGLENQLGAQGAPRMSSTLGNPVLLATYLVLGLPFLVTQLLHSRTREQRDLWVACTTIALIGVFLTHTRMGLVALVVTASVFLWKTSHRYIGILALAVPMVLGVMLVGRGLRMSVPEVTAEVARRGVTAEHVFSAPPLELLLGVGSTRRLAMSPIPEQDARWISTSMHLTLIRQNGLIGWVLMLWVFGAALAALYRGYEGIHDPHMRRIVWAIFSSLVGFVISMTDANVFFNVTIQIYVWGMIGVGMGIITHLNGKRPTFHVLWRFGEHGD